MKARTLVASLALLVIAAQGAYAQTVSNKTTTSPSDTFVSVPGAVKINDFQVTSQQAGFVLVYDALAPPTDGVFTVPAKCWPVPPPLPAFVFSGFSMGNPQLVPRTTLGAIIEFSAGADCYHPLAAPAYISVDYQ